MWDYHKIWFCEILEEHLKNTHSCIHHCLKEYFPLRRKSFMQGQHVAQICSLSCSKHTNIVFITGGCTSLLRTQFLIQSLGHWATLSPTLLWPCSLPFCSIALQRVSIRLCQPLAQKTHTLTLWHTFCAYLSPTHTSRRHRETQADACPPHTQLQRALCAFTGWAAIEHRERDWWEGEDGDRKKEKYYKEQQT